MKRSRIMVLFLVMVIPFTASAQRSRRPRVRSRMLEGVVVDTIAGPRWDGIVIESGGKKYSVVLHMNRPVEGGSIDPTVVGGNVESPGTRVRVFYTGMGSQSNEPIDLYAIRVVKLTNQTVVPREGRQSFNKIPSDLMEQIVKDYSDLAVREYINALKGGVAEYTRPWRVERVDLNRDGLLDFLIDANSAPFAGSHVNSVLIYQKTLAGYRNLTSRGSEPAVSASTRLVVGRSYTNGFVDLYLVTRGKKEPVIFNGRYYQ